MCVLAFMAALVVHPSQAQSAELGVVGDITWGQSRADVDREVELMRAAGVRWIRASVNWRWLEADQKGTIDTGLLAQYDYAIDRARQAGLQVLMPVQDGVPYWASSDPNKRIENGSRRWDQVRPPSDMGDFGDFVRFVVDRYSDRGVHAYEIWNEPNIRWFWSPQPDAGGFVKMLRAGSSAVRAADPTATVVLGGLSKSDFEYLEDVYAAGGKDLFDAVGVHPYTYGVDPEVSWMGTNSGEDPHRLSYNSFPALKEVRATMEAHGDAHKKVWITEFGYSTTSADGGVSEARQAEFLVKSLRQVERLPWVHSLFVYQARDTPFNNTDTYEGRFGLMTTDWKPKPAYGALRAYTGGRPASPPPSVNAPSVVTRPGKGNKGKGRRRKPRISVRRSRGRLSINGRVPRALRSGARVRLVLQRYSPRTHRWHQRRVLAKLTGSRYSHHWRAGKLRHGRWRVRAEVLRPLAPVSRSPFRRFRMRL